MLGLFEIVSLTVAGSSAVLDTLLGGKEVMLGVVTVVALVVVLILGVRYDRIFGVDERIVARVGTLIVVRDSSEREREREREGEREREREREREKELFDFSLS
jgi:uncharacterized membrane protein YkvI